MDGSVRVEGHDRAGVERLVRYCARGPLALERLHAIDGQAALASPQARLLYRLAEPDLQGRTELVLSPLDLLERLARLVPPPRDRLQKQAVPAATATTACSLPTLDSGPWSSPSAGKRSPRSAPPSHHPRTIPQPYRGLRRLQPLPNRRAPRAPPASAGLSSSPASTITESTAGSPEESSTQVRVTHPFHPLCGEVIDFVERRHNWGEDRVFYRDQWGHLTSMPAGWTSVEAEDPFVVVAAGRSWFRANELVELARLVLEHRS